MSEFKFPDELDDDKNVDLEVSTENDVEIEIVDEAAGEFLEVSQEGGKLRFDAEEWPHVRDAVEKMFKLCRNYD